MSNSFTIESVVERSVNNSVSSLVGNNDTNLKTIVKMSIMKDMNRLDTEEMESLLQKLQENNAIEKYYIEREYGLTYDLCGNIIPVGNQGQVQANGENSRLLSPTTPP